MKERLKTHLITFLKGLLYGLMWFVIILVWTLFIVLIFSMLVVPYMIIILPVVYLIIKLVIKIGHIKFLSVARANVIVHGARGSGKGHLFQYVAIKEPQILSNVYFGDNTIITPPKAYFESISPNISLDMIENKSVIVKKNEAWEGVPYFLDDVSVYFPNYLDDRLKKLYPSMSLFIPIQRHLYNSYTIINVQSIDRAYKILRELQTDGYIKALKTWGYGYIWCRLPIVRKYTRTAYRYHEQLDSALNNRLPFDKLGLMNRTTSPIYTTTAEALKEQYTGQNGIIFDGAVWMKKKHRYYDSRIFHEILFGYKASFKQCETLSATTGAENEKENNEL